jgi:hypothetical protein
MKCIVGVFIGSLIALAIGRPGFGDVLTWVDISVATREVGATGFNAVEVDVSTADRSMDASSVLYAELSFDEELTTSTRIELWENPTDNSMPWDHPAEHTRWGVWKVGKGTDRTVRYDITDAVRGWLNGSRNDGLLLRAMTEDGEVRDMTLGGQPNFQVELHVSHGR